MSNPPALSAFTVTVDGSAATVSSVACAGVLTATERDLAPDLRLPSARARPSLSPTPTPPSGNDTAAIQDTTGNDAADLHHRHEQRPRRHQQLHRRQRRSSRAGASSPTGLSTSATSSGCCSSPPPSATPPSTDIATYNTFIQTRAAAGHADIQAYSAGFRVVGCTSDGRATMRGGGVDARDNTETTYISDRQGRPHLLAQRRQGRRRVRGFLRRVLGRRGQRQERVRHQRPRYLPARQLPLDRLRPRRHRGCHGQ